MTANRFFIALSFLFICAFSFGQKNADSKEWTLLQTVDGVKVEFRKGDCNIPSLASYTEQVYIRFTNTSDKLVTVVWTNDMTYGNRCYNCDGNNEEMNQSLKLSPNSSVEGKCEDDNDLRLRIFSKFLNMENPEPLNDFHIKIVSVKEIQE
jgi:hypothetical protein